MFLLVALAHAAPAPTLTVHEWGTFTAVAGTDGRAIQWRPLLGPSDLPEFVYDGTASSGVSGIRPLAITKASPGMIRMETPVIYFYPSQEMEVSLRVDFPEGQITEWYPRIRERTEAGGVDWGTFRLLPGADLVLPDDGSDSHYYPARAVAASPLRVCGPDGNEHEQFLFYRGVGDFALSMAVYLKGGWLTLGPQAPQHPAVVFERDGDAVGFAVIAPGDLTTRRPALDDSMPEVLGVLDGILQSTGLYADEAAAMLATWEDDWFEDGLRVLYVLPREETDALLPLTMSPQPDDLVRTIVGRIEVITPQMEIEARRLLADTPETQISGALSAEFGRFTEPVLRRIEAPEGLIQQIADEGQPDHPGVR